MYYLWVRGILSNFTPLNIEVNIQAGETGTQQNGGKERGGSEALFL